MLRSHTISTKIKLEVDDLRRIFPVLDEKGWIPVILASEIELASRLGLQKNVSLRSKDSENTRANFYVRGFSDSEIAAHGGNIFLYNGDIYYVIPFHQIGPTVSIRADEQTLEVGILSKKNDDLSSLLDVFAELFQEALHLSLDGRKTRHMAFDWKPVEKLVRERRFLLMVKWKAKTASSELK